MNSHNLESLLFNSTVFEPFSEDLVEQVLAERSGRTNNMLSLLAVFLLACCTSLSVAEFGAGTLKGHVTIRSDSDSASFSADQSADSEDSVDNEVQMPMPMEPCFLTQTCEFSNDAIQVAQPAEFDLIQMALSAVPETNMLFTSALTILDQQDAVLNNGVLASDFNCFMSQDTQSPFAALSKSSLGFSVVLDRTGDVLLFTYTYTNLPSSFGTLRVIFAFSLVTGFSQPTFQFRSTEGEFLELNQRGEIYTLDEPLICGGAEPTDSPDRPPTLPPALAGDLGAVTTAIQNALCPTT
ncbi:uncharacterized protein LOC135818910 [Sycon ciliatum]|uniref:uncharacterized protein LOC135818910 n=1 Tax=Sycon ciliatum TaxID=27933 RepID=UPI0031F60266